MSVFDQAAAGRVRAAARQAIETHHLPGIAIGVVEGADLVFAEGFGYADIESREPHDPARRQRIASVTKTMTGLCLMALVDEARLSLDDLVVRLLPEVRFHGPAETMTLRHLLTHSSGIGEAPTEAALAATASPNIAGGTPAGDFSTRYPDGIVVEARPGEKWAYCNHGYALLGEVIARAETATLHDVFQHRIFGPLGMADSDCLDQPHHRLTTGYHRATDADTRDLFERAGIEVKDESTVDGHNIRSVFAPEPNTGDYAAGAVQSTIPDMARYAAALLDGSRGIVLPKTFDAMTAAQWCPDDRLVSWGLAFARAQRYGYRTFGHGGAFFGGWNSNLTVIPDLGIAVIQHMNVMLSSPAPVFNGVIRAVLDSAEPVASVTPIDGGLLEAAPGVYECAPGRLTNFRPATRIGRILIERAGDGLVLRSRRGPWKGGVVLRRADDGDPALFVIETPDADPARIALTLDATGRPNGLRFDDLVHMVRAGNTAVTGVGSTR
jgi:CubicO group peptidase (beta-lactamase class C family)